MPVVSGCFTSYVIPCKYVDEPYVVKARVSGYPPLKTASSNVLSFWQNTGVWRTDGQTKLL